jgi:carboxyvinyl-carboxyphosphonate phosphorylmutase
MTFDRPRRRLREMLRGSQVIFPASVADPLSARMAEEIGYPACFLAGSLAAMTTLAAPDISLIFLSELVEQTRRICRATDLPLIVDADDGFADPPRLHRAVEELAAAGAAALTIEDTLLPVPAGCSPSLVPVDEAVQKLRAVLLARRDPDLVVIARTGAAGLTGLDDAIRRARAFEAAGPDALFFTGITHLDQIREISRNVSLPILTGMIESAGPDEAVLAEAGISLYLRGHDAFAAASTAYYRTLLAEFKGDRAQAEVDADLLRTLVRTETHGKRALRALEGDQAPRPGQT